MAGTHTMLGESWKWETMPLSVYSLPIPLFAINDAKNIKRKLPKAKFIVESLVQKRIVKDPFLIVEYEGTRKYISVWGEAKFEAEQS